MFGFLKKIFGKTSKKVDTAKKVEKQKKATDYKTAFDINFCLEFNNKLMRHDSAVINAKNLKRNMVFNNLRSHEAAILSIFSRENSKSQISLISRMYYNLYNEDLLDCLQKNVDQSTFNAITELITNLKD